MTEQEYMRRAISLARQGAGYTNPNPMVGAVIVRDGEILGEGWHTRCGALHAEREALAHCKASPAGATIYVTLEPCCHQGRQPPCTQALLDAGISRVVIGSRDPNPKVAGKGAAILREHGVEVVEDFLRAECDALNPIFFHYITTGLPYVCLKYAMTADGKIASATGASRWITGETARRHVHTLRNLYAGILVGIGTVLRDDPLLTCRIPGGKNPVRIVLDSTLRIPLTCQLVTTAGEVPTLVACAAADREKQEALEAAGVTVLPLPGPDGRVDIPALLRALARREIDSVLVEGGGGVNEAMLMAGAVQKVYAYLAPKLLGGKDAPGPVGGRGYDDPNTCALLSPPTVTPLGEDLLLEYEVKR